MVQQMSNVLTQFRELIANAIAIEKSYNLPNICTKYGLDEGDEGEAHRSKRHYVLKRIEDKNQEELIKLSKLVLEDYYDYDLEEFTWLQGEGKASITQITRRHILDYLSLQNDDLSGDQELVIFLERIFPLGKMSSKTDGRFRNASGEIHQHMVNNDDWDTIYLFKYLDMLGVSDRRFKMFVEALVHPLVRIYDKQEELVKGLNRHLIRDGFELRVTSEESGYPIYLVCSVKKGVEGEIKNLIFASNGPKPEIVLVNALHNEIVITKNSEYCLIYKEEIPITGLMWSNLVKWWSIDNALEYTKESAMNLHSRLFESLKDSEPEQFLFNRYFKFFSKLQGSSLPALIPQVYFHYDPYTIRQLGGEKRVIRQRMDFLILFSRTDRVVIEIDGKHHYTNDDNIASPSKYAEMAKADRELRLAGYEIYRFGGSELVASNPNRVKIVEDFFLALFKKHRVLK